MGRRLLAVLMTVAFLSGVALLSLAGAATKQEVPPTIELLAKLWTDHTKGPVNFQHQKHQEEYKVKCEECHHIYKDGKNTWKRDDPVKKCMDCHTEPTVKGEKKLPEDKQKLNLKLAMHDNCQGCHKKLKKEDKKKYAEIPTTCVKCHAKK